MKKKLCKILCGVGALCITVVVGSFSVSAETKEANIPKERTGYEQTKVIEIGEKDEVVLSNKKYKSYGASAWDQYSSDYFYNQMNSNEKAFYEKLYYECMEVLTTTVNLQTYSQTAVTDFVTYSGLTEEQAQNVALIFQMSNPQFYFINEYMVSGSTTDEEGYLALGVYSDFADGATRANSTSVVKSKIDSWVAQIKAQDSVLNMQKEAHDLVAENSTYDLNGTYNQSSYSVFIDGKTVCAGYAEAYELLCNAVGIDTICITSENHEWNKSYVYGMWYVVDCTWDDSSIISYDYFDCSDEYAQYGNTSHDLESVWTGYSVPESTSDAGVDGFISNYSYEYSGVDYAAVFDIDDYISKYADIREAYGADVNSILAHFVNNGMAEGRQGSTEFNVFAYANRYDDLQTAFGNDLKSYYLHYINSGKAEGRNGTGSDTGFDFVVISNVTVYNGIDYSSVYNATYYYQNNPDVANALGTDGETLLWHFVNYGMQEGRCASTEFNVVKYMYGLLNDDLRAAFGGDMKQYYYHYMNYGQYEGRSVSDYDSVFDAEYYLTNNPDVKENLVQRYTSDGNLLGWALWHYYEYGMNEGRRGNAAFGVYNYEAANPDVYEAYRTDYRQATIHYMQNGIGRATCGSIDIYSMSELRPDVYAMYNGNPDAMINWYIFYGNLGM